MTFSSSSTGLDQLPIKPNQGSPSGTAAIQDPPGTCDLSWKPSRCTSRRRTPGGAGALWRTGLQSPVCCIARRLNWLESSASDAKQRWCIVFTNGPAHGGGPCSLSIKIVSCPSAPSARLTDSFARSLHVLRRSLVMLWASIHSRTCMQHASAFCAHS